MNPSFRIFIFKSMLGNKLHFLIKFFSFLIRFGDEIPGMDRLGAGEKNPWNIAYVVINLLCCVVLYAKPCKLIFLIVWFVAVLHLPTSLLHRHHCGVSMGNLYPTGVARTHPVWYYLQLRTGRCVTWTYLVD